MSLLPDFLCLPFCLVFRQDSGEDTRDLFSGRRRQEIFGNSGMDNRIWSMTWDVGGWCLAGSCSGNPSREPGRISSKWGEFVVRVLPPSRRDVCHRRFGLFSIPNIRTKSQIIITRFNNYSLCASASSHPVCSQPSPFARSSLPPAAAAALLLVVGPSSSKQPVAVPGRRSSRSTIAHVAHALLCSQRLDSAIQFSPRRPCPCANHL